MAPWMDFWGWQGWPPTKMGEIQIRFLLKYIETYIYIYIYMIWYVYNYIYIYNMYLSICIHIHIYLQAGWKISSCNGNSLSPKMPPVSQRPGAPWTSVSSRRSRRSRSSPPRPALGLKTETRHISVWEIQQTCGNAGQNVGKCSKHVGKHVENTTGSTFYGYHDGLTELKTLSLTMKSSRISWINGLVQGKI